jgi:signal transduction histidine kinase/ActR/RegA family two-component response regulator
MKTLIPRGEQQRLQALLSYNIFRTEPEPGFDLIASLTARLLGTPMAFVTLTGDDTQWTKACVGSEGIRETSRGLAFCSHTILSDEVLIVSDTELDSRFADNPLVTGPPHIRFYAGCPIKTSSGHNIGSLCVADTEPRQLSAELVDILKDLAASVVDQLELRRCLIENDSRTKVDAEMNYGRLTDAIHGMVFRMSFTSPIDFTYLYVSHGSNELLGLTPEVFVADRLAFIKLIHAEDLESFRTASESVWESMDPWSWKGRIVTTLGQTKWIQGEGSRGRQPDGTEILEGLMFDITESKDKEAALNLAMEASETANQAKSEFLSRMSHEFRTPMNAILGFAQMLEMAPLASEFQEDLAQVKQAGEHLLGLINEVLDLSSIRANRASMAMDSVAIGEVMSETIALLRPLFESNHVQLLPIPEPAEAWVLADRHRLKQVFINLMSNAVKYNRRGGSIVLSIQREDGIVRLDITDEGAGISTENMNRLFTPFDRLGAEETGIEGTGLGLTISRGLVELMGGSLTVSSGEGEGSTFSVRLPEVAPSEAAPAQPRDRQYPEYSGTGTRELLYIEDNESNILLVHRILSNQPEIKISVARTIAAGLDALSTTRPDLLLLDLNLPDGSGEKVIRWVRTESDFTGLPIVVLTADATPWVADLMIAAGADHYLTKPINVPFFRQIMRDMMKDETQ